MSWPAILACYVIIIILSPSFLGAQQPTVFNATDVASLLAATASANDNPGQPAVIGIAPGIYRLKESIVLTADSVSLIGQGQAHVMCSSGASTAVQFRPASDSARTRFSVANLVFSGCSNTAMQAFFPSQGNASMQVDGVSFTNNTGPEAGGLLVKGGGTFTAGISSCNFSSNAVSAPSDYGSFPAFSASAALVSLGGGALSQVSVTDCTFTENYVMIPQGPFSDISNTSFPSSGLAILCEGNVTQRETANSSCSVGVSDSRFSGNRGLSSALLLASAEDLYKIWPSPTTPFSANVSASTFSNNSGITGGGAIGIFNLTDFYLDGSQLYGNKAGSLEKVSFGTIS